MKGHTSASLMSVLLVALTCSAATAQDADPNDWANLARYRPENAAMSPPAPGEDRVVFIGDSIAEEWAPPFAVLFPSQSYINRGIAGQTTPQMLVRFRQDVIALEPKVVVILAGANDIAGMTGPSTLEMIEDNLVSMVELAKANGMEVVLSSVTPAYDFPWKPGLKPAPTIVALNSWIKESYVDYHSALADARQGLPPESLRGRSAS